MDNEKIILMRIVQRAEALRAEEVRKKHIDRGCHDQNFDMAASHEYKTALSDLATYIKGSLDCNANGTGVPCRTDRLTAVNMMTKLLKLSGYEEIST